MTGLDLTGPDLIGIVGSVLVCGAYWAVSNGRVDPLGMRYHGVNAAGAGLLLVSLWFRPNLGAAIVEGLWFVIAMASILRALRRR